MKILFVNHTSSFTGAPISCLNLMTRLGEGFTPVFASSEKGPLIDKLEKSGIKSYIVKNKGFLGLRYIAAFIGILRTEKIDVLFLNTLTPFCKYAGIAGFLLRIPIVWVIRENPLISRSKRLRLWLKLISSKIVFVDRDTRKNLLPGMSKNIEVIYNGVDTEAFRPLRNDHLFKVLNIDTGQRLIGYAGLITKRKGLEHLIKALPVIKEEHEQVKLIIIGGYKENEEPYFRKIKQSVKELSLEKDVYFTGMLLNMGEALNSLDLLILPSLEERCSRVLLESLACGKAVVATRVGGTPEIIEDGVNGILVDAENEKQIAKAVLKLLKNDGLREKFGMNGRMKAEKNFNITENINRMKKLFQEIKS